MTHEEHNKQRHEEQRPWGNFVEFSHNETTTVKILTVKPQQQLSLQYHHKRSEFWKVLSGNPIITLGEKILNAKPDDEFFVEQGMQHRIAAQAQEVKILEISYGDFDEQDIVRLKDMYKRI